MVSRGDATIRVRPKYGSGNHRKGINKTCRQYQPASQSSSTSLKSSNALCSMGPYTYIVRQPGRMKLPGESCCTAVSDSEVQTHLGVGSCSADRRRPKQEKYQDEEAPLWISPVLPQRQGEKEVLLKEASGTPETPAFFPLPQSPLPVCVDASESCINSTGKQEQRGKSTLSQKPQQRGVGTSAPSTTLLTELLSRIQQQHETELSLSPCTARSKLSPEVEGPWNSPRENHHHLHERQQQSSCGCLAASRLSGDSEEQRHAPQQRAARLCRKQALQFVGIDAEREEGPFTESDLSPLARASDGRGASLNTLEREDRLLCGISEDEKRLRRWIAERGLLPNEDTAAHRIFIDYLKKKADRLERDYDELFWSSRQRSPPRLEKKERYHWHDYPSRQEEKLRRPLNGAMLGVEKQEPFADHPYSIDANVSVGIVPSPTFAPTKSLINGKVHRGPVFSGGKELPRDMPIASTFCCRGGAGEKTKFSRSVGSPRLSERKSSSHKKHCDMSLFYTGNSIAKTTTRTDKRWRKSNDGRSSSLSSSSHSAQEEQATNHQGHLSVTERGTSPPSPQEEVRQKREEEKHCGEKKVMDGSRLMEKKLDILAVNDATSTAAAPKRTFSFPTVFGIEDASEVIRLRNYCHQLDKELVQLFRSGAARHQWADAEKDVMAAAVKETTRESLQPAHCMHTKTTSATDLTRRRSIVFSPPPPPPPPPPSSLPTASALIARRPHEATESAINYNALTQFNISPVSFPSYGERGLPSVAHHDESRKEYDAAKVLDHTAFPGTPIDDTTGQITPPESLIPSALGQDVGRCSGGDQGVLSPSTSFVSSRHISPMPHEIRTTMPSGLIKEMELRRSLAASRVSSVNQSIHHTPPRLLVHNENVSENVVSDRDANPPYTHLECSYDKTVMDSSPTLKGDVQAVVPTLNTGLNCGHLIESDFALEHPKRSITRSPFLKRDVTSAEDESGNAKTQELTTPSKAHKTTMPPEGLKTNPGQKIPGLVSSRLHLLPSKRDNETPSIHSIHNLTKRPGSIRKNGGPGSVTWSGSSSSSSSSDSSGSVGKNIIGVDVKKKGALSRTPVERRRFSLLVGGSTSSAATPIVNSRSSLGAKNRVEGNRANKREKTGRTSFVRGGGELPVVEVGVDSHHVTPRRNSNPFFVGVLNPGIGSENRHKVVERREGGASVSRSHRFGVPKSIR
ncbi:hypothetical protein MOQ_003338 [Trypanosoma cruzi marinkellei]|uniref:Uncharacterized protein n=1 Tax=Trypanosoma cruzi marinkellei TaxID=85056 RepID=K2ND32_TRYCR|nr:hypothetical protein MOQ_003338 [Trypanosoma cruzi marinkellei]